MLRRVLLWGSLLAVATPAVAAPPPADTVGLAGQVRQAQALLLRSPDSAATLSWQVLRRSQRLHSASGQAQGYLLLGAVMRNAGEFDSAFYYSRRAQALFEILGQPSGVAEVHVLNAQTYKRMGDTQDVAVLSRKGLREAELAVDLARHHDLPGPLVAALLNQGIIYRDLDQPDSARACYQAAIEVELRRHPRPSLLGVAYADYGQVLAEADHDYAAAIGYFRRAVAIYRTQHQFIRLEHAYRQLSFAYRLQGRPLAALAAADTCLALGRASHDPHRLANSLEAAYLACHAAGRNDLAYPLLEERRLLDNQLNALAKTQAVARLEATYRLEKQQARIRELNETNGRKQRQLGVLGAGVALLAALLAFGAWQYRAQRQANAQLQATNQTVQDNHQRIQEQASRLTLLLRELHHRVKNNLAIVSSLLNLQSGTLADPAAARAVREGRQRVEAMSLIHQRLYQADEVATVDLRPFLSTLTENLLAAYGFAESQVELLLDLAPNLPPQNVDRAIPLGLLLNELLTNAFKHAFAEVATPCLRLHLSAPEGGLLLEVEDNGPGCPPSAASGSGGFGTQLIMALSAQLGGQVQTANRPGAYFQLWVPAPAA